MNIESYIRKYGYKPEYCTNDPEMPKYEKALLEYLGIDKYRIFNELRDEPKIEESKIMEFVQNDVNLLRMILSSQIKISTKILDGIREIIHELKLKPDNILELGGADGWAADYLSDFFKWKIKKTIVDSFKSWEPVKENTLIIHKNYFEFKSQEKFDLIISLLGSNLVRIEELIDCILLNLTETGTAIISIRIPSETDYFHFIELCFKKKLEILNDFSFRISSQNQKIPILTLKKSNKEFSLNEVWRSTRESFLENDNPKRFFGSDGLVMFDLIKDGEMVYSEKKEWENGDFFEINIFSKNEVLFRVITNSFNNIIIESPIRIDDEFNKIENQLQRLHYSPELWSSSI